MLERDGEILEQLPAGKYMVKLKDTDMIITCYKAGKMKHLISESLKVIGLKLKSISYDMKQGRIVYRYNVATKAPTQE